MVSKKSAKTAKVSYAELKKNAQDNKEKLGPHWSSWIGHAIRKLEEDGILESSQSATGNITLTPSGKKAITDARQSLSIMINTSPSAVPDELIWKHLTQSAPTHGEKRGRPSIRPVHDSDEESNHVPDGLASTNRATRAKRQRISVSVSSQPKAPRTQVTKLQLQAELRALQKEKANGLWLRESSPLTDLDGEEEAVRLRSELKEKQEEIERIRRELDEAKAGDLTLYRPPTPDIETRPSSPMRKSSGIPGQPRPLDRVLTQSGSCISLLSRQPTPPRSPGAISDEGHGFGTQYDLYTENFQDTAIASMDSLRVIELERDISMRVAEIQSLEAQRSQLQVNAAEAQQALFERDEQLSALSASFSRLQGDASQKALDLERRIKELLELQTLKSGFEPTRSSRVAGLEHDLKDRDASIDVLNTDRKKASAEIVHLREILSIEKHDKTVLASQLAESNLQIQKVRSEVAEQLLVADSEAQAQRMMNAESGEKVEALRARVSELEQRIGALRQSEETTTRFLLESRAHESLASEKLRDAKASNESLLDQLTTATDEQSELQAALEVSRDEVITLSLQVSTLAKSISHSEANVKHLTQSLAAAEYDKGVLLQQVTTAELSASTLQSDLSLSKESTEELSRKLAVIMKERAEFSSELDKAHETITASASSMTQLKDRLVTTTDNMEKAENKAAEFRTNLDAAIDKLKDQEDRNGGLVEEIERKAGEIAQLARNLTMAESTAERYRSEVVAGYATVQELREQLLSREGELKTVQESLLSVKAVHLVEYEKQTVKSLEVEGALQSARIEIGAIQLQLSTGRLEKAALQTQVDEQSVELAESRAKEAAESQRANRLEAELLVVAAKAQDAEEELMGLRASKAEDETTIEHLKGMFSAHVEKQTQSLAVLNSQVISTKSSPAPIKRRSARTTGKAPIPLKLTK